SALDTVTEARVHAQLAAMACTRIVVAHRMSTVVGADMIVVVDAGRGVARGTHAELVLVSPLYRELAGVRQPGPGAVPAPVATAPVERDDASVDVVFDPPSEPTLRVLHAASAARTRDRVVELATRRGTALGALGALSRRVRA